MGTRRHQGSRTARLPVALVTLTLVAGAGLVACQPPPILSITVNTTTDGRDAMPGDDVCEMTVGAGDCSLRAAVGEASASPDVVNITVPGGTYVLAAADAEIRVPSGPVNVNVHSDAGAVVDASAVAAGFHVDGSLNLAGLTVHGALVASVLVGGSGHLSLVGSTLSGSPTGVLGQDHSAITAVLSTFTDNGVGVDATGTVTIANSTISGNRGTGLVIGSTNLLAEATVSNSTIADNHGAGIEMLNSDTTTIVGSTIAHNSSPVSCVGDTSVCASPNAGPGGVFAKHGNLTVVNSTIADNTVDGAGFGGIQVGFEKVLGLGSLDSGFGNLTVTSSTLVDAPIVLTLGTYQPTASLLDHCLTSSLIDASWVVDGGGNVVVGGSACLLPSATVVTDPMLGPLADNGGFTQTFLPQPGSPLIDHIPPGTAHACDGSIATDQRGVSRPQGPACDVGSVELVP